MIAAGNVAIYGPMVLIKELSWVNTTQEKLFAVIYKMQVGNISFSADNTPAAGQNSPLMPRIKRRCHGQNKMGCSIDWLDHEKALKLRRF